MATAVETRPKAALPVPDPFPDDFEPNQGENQPQQIRIERHFEQTIFAAERYGCVNEAATIAVLGDKISLFFIPREAEKRREVLAAAKQFNIPGSDYLTMLNVWNQYQQHKDDKEWLEKNPVNQRVMRDAEDMRKKIVDRLQEMNMQISTTEDETAIQKAVAVGFKDKLMKYDSREKVYRLNDDPSQKAVIDRASAVSGNPLYIIAGKISPDTRADKDTNYAKPCQEIKTEWLSEIAPELFPPKKTTPPTQEPVKQKPDEKPTETKSEGSNTPKEQSSDTSAQEPKSSTNLSAAIQKIQKTAERAASQAPQLALPEHSQQQFSTSHNSEQKQNFKQRVTTAIRLLWNYLKSLLRPKHE